MREKFGMVFQLFNLFENLSVLDNVTIGRRKVKKIPKEQAEKKAMELLKQVGLESKADVYPSKLSGGQKQRVAIAKGLALGSKIILMDEPFASLDAMTRNKMQSELLHIKEKEKMTVIFITHNIQEAISLGNKIMVMSKNGTIKEKMDNPISKPVTPASEGYGELWEHLNNALTEENKEK